VKVLRMRLPARCASASRTSAREREPELADVRDVRGPADFDPMMPPFVTAFLMHVWGRAREQAP
jgi:hypothetical protein